MFQEQRTENTFDQANDEPIGFIKIIPSEPITFTDKPIRITMAEPEVPKTEDKEKNPDKKKTSGKDKLKSE